MKTRLAITLLIGLSLTACVTRKPVADQNPRWVINHEAYALAKPKDVKVEISLSSQTAQMIDRNGNVLLEMDVSTGKPKKPTPPGKFRVMEKLPLKASGLYGQYVMKETGEVVVARTWEHEGPKPEGTVYKGIDMPFWLRLTNDGVGMHVGGFPRGSTTSHGCIRCPEEPQKLVYDKARVGMRINVINTAHTSPSLLAQSENPAKPQ